MPRIDVDSFTVRTMKDGSYLLEDDEFSELFRLNLKGNHVEVLRDVCRLINRYYEQGKAAGRAELKDDFSRLMGIPRC